MDAADPDRISDGESNSNIEDVLDESQFDENDAVQVKKHNDIRAACEARDVTQLQALAESRGGFLTDALRKSACKRSHGPISPSPLHPIMSIQSLSTCVADPQTSSRSGPILLGLPPPLTDLADEALPADAALDAKWKDLPRHGDEEQVQLDVNRSFVYYPNGKYLSANATCRRKG